MKIRPRKAKISHKAFDYPSFEQVTREGPEDPRFAKVIKKPGARELRVRQPIAGQRCCGIGYVSLKNLPDIVRKFASDRVAFGRLMNEYIEALYELILDAGGKMTGFADDGLLFVFENTAAANGATQAAVMGLKIRYRMNKMNRTWGFLHEDSWKVRTGVCAGPVTIVVDDASGGTAWKISGEFADLARAISRCAGTGQVLLTDDAYNDPKFNQGLFETGSPRVMQPHGSQYSTRVREIVAMVRKTF